MSPISLDKQIHQWCNFSNTMFFGIDSHKHNCELVELFAPPTKELISCKKQRTVARAYMSLAGNQPAIARCSEPIFLAWVGKRAMWNGCNTEPAEPKYQQEPSAVSETWGQAFLTLPSPHANKALKGRVWVYPKLPPFEMCIRYTPIANGANKEGVNIWMQVHGIGT